MSDARIEKQPKMELRVRMPQRNGIRFRFSSTETRMLPWDDCDRIIEVLEKAGIK